MKIHRNSILVNFPWPYNCLNNNGPLHRPPYSPKMNTIVHLQDILVLHIGQYDHPPSIHHVQQHTVSAMWDQIP